MVVDSHVHVEEREGPGGYAAVLARAAQAGVLRVVAVGGSARMNAGALAAAAEFPQQVRATLGYDRGMATEVAPDAATLDAAMQVLRSRIGEAGATVVAVGECGLDYHYSPDRPADQRRLFEAQLALALELDRPLVVHSRDAVEDTLACLRPFAAAGGRGVLHCFTGEVEFARALMDIGFMISFSGIVTFRTAEALRAVARGVPDDFLLIETDSPHLAPVPQRGQVNEPAFVMHVAAALATVRGCSPEHVASVTTRNASRLFAWP